jgi:arginase family enzyme
MKTTAVFFPFDLFGSAGTAPGAELLADALKEVLADTRRERLPTRARAYQDQVRIQEIGFAGTEDYESWRPRARKAIARVLGRGDFLLWATGNHLGVLPVYDELAASAADTLVIQLDAHLDIYNLSDCTAELSHGNFLLHAEQPLPRIVNLGSRELLLEPDYIARYYGRTFSAAELAVSFEPALAYLRKSSRQASRVFIDLDCDVFDPAFFPAVTHPLPFGLTATQVLRVLDAVWSPRVMGLALSEFDPARDRQDQSLAMLMWLMEHLLLRLYESNL